MIEPNIEQPSPHQQQQQPHQGARVYATNRNNSLQPRQPKPNNIQQQSN